MPRLHSRLLISGGPDNSLSGWPKATGGYDSTSFHSLPTRNSPATSCALRAPGQQVVRATKKNIASAMLALFLMAVSLAHAQNDTNASPATPADSSANTTAPAANPPPFVPNPTSNAVAPAVQSIMPNGAAPSGGQEDIADIRPPFFYLHSWFWLWLALAIAAFFALLAIVWKRVSRPAFLSPKSAYDLTLEKLEKARSMLDEEDPMPYAVFVSETIRSYLGQRFQTPSTRRTTEEFLRIMENDPTTPLAEHRDSLRDFLVACDLVKFGKYQPTIAEMEQVQQTAFTFVHATKPVPVEATASGRKP